MDITVRVLSRETDVLKQKKNHVKAFKDKYISKRVGCNSIKHYVQRKGCWFMEKEEIKMNQSQLKTIKNQLQFHGKSHHNKKSLLQVNIDTMHME